MVLMSNLFTAELYYTIIIRIRSYYNHQEITGLIPKRTSDAPEQKKMVRLRSTCCPHAARMCAVIVLLVSALTE